MKKQRGGPEDYNLISLDKYIKMEPTTEDEEYIKDLKEAVKRKANGAKCIVCGNIIWALGSATCGSDMCFSCITGEADASEDFEVYYEQNMD